MKSIKTVARKSARTTGDTFTKEKQNSTSDLVKNLKNEVIQTTIYVSVILETCVSMQCFWDKNNMGSEKMLKFIL